MLNNKLIFLFVSILILFNLTSCIKKDNIPDEKKKKEPLSINAIQVFPQQFNFSIEVNGTIIPSEFAEIRPELSGKIVKLNIKEGSVVSKDVLIASLFNNDLTAELNKTESQLEKAQKTANRLKKLIEVNGINVEEYDRAVLETETFKADIDNINAQISKTQIKAPFTGVIGLRNVSMGAYVTNQTVLTTIQQIDKLKLDFNVPEEYTYLIKNGNIIKFITENSNDTNSAKIIAYEPVINEMTRNLKVRALIEKTANLVAGKFATVFINVEQKKNFIVIPSQIIIPDTRFKKVFLIKNGIAEFVKIETGIRRENDVQVLSGLKPGDTLAVNGLLHLKPKMPVKIKLLN